MHFPKTIALTVVFAATSAALLAAPKQAQAQTSSPFLKTYKVQVEYWFFDTDYYYWSTQFESSNLNDALAVYEELRRAKENRRLNEAAPSGYGRYIAVDVRMITEYHYPQVYKSPYSNLQLKSYR